MTDEKLLSLGDLYCEDPEWNRALAALDHEGDTTLMADLFRKGHAPPPEAMSRLAVLMKPPKGYRGKKLVALEWRGGRKVALDKLGAARKLRQKIKSSSGKRSSAITDSNTTRATAYRKLRLDDDKALADVEVILGLKSSQKLD